jgi:plasmid segregation protein ParM
MENKGGKTMILGIDLGNYATKTSEGVVFDSRISLGHKKLNNNDTKVEYNGKQYTVGTGRLEIGENRVFSELYDICLLTAIAKSFPGQLNISVDLVVGLPPTQFESDLKEELQDKLNDFGTKYIIVNGIKVSITINKGVVFSESAIVFSNPSEFRKKNTLIVDIGGGTADISEFDRELVNINKTTTEFGMLSLYEEMRKEFNRIEKAKYTTDKMEELLYKNTEEVKGVKRNISYLKDTISDHVSKICNVINQNFDIDSTRIILIGGGAAALIEYFKKQYENAELAENNQIINAKTYEIVGKMLWGE